MKIIAVILLMLTTLARAEDGPTPKTATKDAPFVNSLGMKFVPVEITGGPTNGKRILFGIWDTRVQDYAEFAKAKGVTLENPGFAQGPTHPASCVSWEDAKAFCGWLTEKERGNGRIGARDEYRLPSDHEWSCAIGIGRMENAEETPETKNGKIANAYPWGKQWPPPTGAGNYASSLLVDEFLFTSPVGSFHANEYGLYDMGGNVEQWCEDWYDAKQERRVMRGASWNPSEEIYLRSSFRLDGVPAYRYVDSGFRCVLVVSGG